MLVPLFFISAAAAYFMDTYHIILDDSMLRNVFQTDVAEASDLLTPKLAAYLFLLGIVPSWIVVKLPLAHVGWRRAFWQKSKRSVILLLFIGATILLFGKHYASFFREHRILRDQINPLYWIYSVGRYVHNSIVTVDTSFKTIATDAVIPASKDRVKKLVILVVGEAARADHFSLNGYPRRTTPLLSRYDIVNLPNTYSCATSTAESVPCMFSVYTRDDYSYEKAQHTENILDILQRTGKVALLWRDNNSDSKGVADRIAYQNFKTPHTNPVCIDGECRDIGMLRSLDDFIAEHNDKDILIVLHQMGNHGPAYYKRYPHDYEHFTPVCRTNKLETCKREAIVNAYDNALRYSDTFWVESIRLLKRYDDRYKTALIYMADHGESLGENGIYLHGLPYFIAPEAQKHIGAFLWFGKQWIGDERIIRLRRKRNETFSHDYLFHTLLGIFDVETKVYDPSLDLLKVY